ncbi:MAG: hypothetical protein UT13_C0001G0508 [Candidatus Pacebacteria bacterium GW2011_GWF2_38_9]|nr:MAG: hypothetical protein US01_C0001G0521 [candidate division TM6 bacterium GW2011_GWF2_28_16]KKQ09315.1 MAG: hypothetical protein US20_C0008G0013 [Candidatus Pacebacteria bacterium GW2011_GWF1_36_5]KKQ88861.1 MAG: hypothetical protein UT13_C0001G0508 [Candidatus Pacebacteria bacterium GW2011_GWF2_38_9]HAZ73442.1 hypothetical protein [Candidatus Paceibacterota bacterium]
MLKRFLYQLRRLLYWPLRDFAYLTHPLFNANSSSDQLSQKQILNQYLSMRKAGLLPLPISQVGWRAFSQFDEDGILLYIFSIIGSSNRLAVEIGADCESDFFQFPESNTTNLLVNHDWQGLIIDASKRNIKKLKRFFRNCKSTTYKPPVLLQALVNRQNINHLIKKAGFTGEIDLFSLDVDSNDYWLFQTLEVIKPRVLVLEFNQFWQSKDAVTIPYQNDLDAFLKLRQKNPSYFGASLAAMVKLAKQKGYRLVALNSFGHNAFFVRKDLGLKFLPTLPVKYTVKQVAPSHDLKWMEV